VSLEGQHHVTPLYLRVPATAPIPSPSSSVGTTTATPRRLGRA